MSDSRKSSVLKNQDFKKIRDDYVESEELFCDEFFKLDVTDAVWLRPKEICKDPRFIIDGATRFDLIQGRANNCWLIVAMAHLTMNKALFQHVVPVDQSFKENYVGAFHFRLWQCGTWVEVVVDDKLPTMDGELIFVHSKEQNEFWSALLEKAYAKLYGSYNELSTGWFSEGIIDFTGGIVENMCLKPAPQNLDRILLSSYNRSSFMCVFMNADGLETHKSTPEGLVKGHAYSITKVQFVTLINVPEKILLIRLRNPWGKIEWTGAWSDSSPAWESISDEEKRSMGVLFDNDGEFWMSISDFIRNFQFIDICHLSAGFFQNVVGGSEKLYWEENSFKGEWIKNVNAGGVFSGTLHLNPQFQITLTDIDDNDEENMCTLIISLIQKNTRRVWHRIGYTAFRLDQPESLSGPLSEEYLKGLSSKAITSQFLHRKEVVERHKWPQGVYCIIPSTYSPQTEGTFLLRVFTEKKNTMVDTDEFSCKLKSGALKSSLAGGATSVSPSVSQDKNSGKKLIHRSDQEVKSFFNRTAGRENAIGWQGLQSVLQFALTPDLGFHKRFLNDSGATKFSKSECRTLIAMLDDDRSGKLEFNEFQTLWGKIRQWESIFLQCSKNTDHVEALELKQALTIAGYILNSSVLGDMVRRYGDDEGKLTFEDFVMCAVELQTS